MQLDAIVRRRFTELAEKAERLAAAREPTDSDSFTIPAAPFYEWVTNVQSLLARACGQESVHYQNFIRLANRFTSYEAEFANCRAVFVAAREDYEGGYLFNVRAAAKAEALADALAQAKELLAAGSKEPACVLARVALEVALKELADEHGIPHDRLERMSAALGRAGVYNRAKQKQISAWAEIGTKAIQGHGDDYDERDARAMLDGVEHLVADFL
ncbi:MAG TPA: hypothetical protein VIK32_07840 [Candidatus Limnocylindrales bacterium]